MTIFHEVFDFVVVGSGGGSMCAALVMRAHGKGVVVLEKTDLIGGTTARGGGVMWIPGNSLMKRDGVEDSLERAATYLDALVGDHNDTPGTSRARRDVYLREAPRMLEFLLERGMKFNRVPDWADYYDDLPGGSAFSRAVCPELFDVNELGEWSKKLRRGRLAKYPARNAELFKMVHIGHSWSAKFLAGRMVVRGAIAKIAGKDIVGAGTALQGRMLKACLKEAVDFRTESPVTELIVENGAVKGVVMQKNGQAWRVGARLGVLVNAGGFARNQAMRDRYQPGTSAEWTCAGPGDTGEMIQEMIRHGAAIGQMDEMVGAPLSIPPGAEKVEFKPVVQGMTTSPHCILIDQTGVRYMNECDSYMEFCKRMLERNRTVPAVPSWAIFDQTFMSKYMVTGSLPNIPKPRHWYDRGYLRKSDTIEGLAEQLKVNPTMLKTTIERFNGFVVRNRDEDFGRGNRAYDRFQGDPYHKPSETLGAIETPPFYSVPVVPGDVSTYGGVVTDGHARVLREDGSVIPGLYATGVSTASVMGRFYVAAGSSVGPSFVFGWIAANHAAEQQPHQLG